MLNFIYPAKSEGVINVEAALTIDSTITARGYIKSTEISLGVDYISDVRQIDTLLTQLVNTINSSSNKMLQPRDTIGQGTALLQNAILCFGGNPKEDMDNDLNDTSLLPSIQLTLC